MEEKPIERVCCYIDPVTEKCCGKPATLMAHWKEVGDPYAYYDGCCEHMYELIPEGSKEVYISSI